MKAVQPNHSRKIGYPVYRTVMLQSRILQKAEGFQGILPGNLARLHGLDRSA